MERLSWRGARDGAGGSSPWEVLAAVVTLALPVLAAALPTPAAAQEQTPEELRQQAERMLGRDLTNQEILDMLRQSGLSPEQIRERLSARGYDPGAADPWLRVLEGRASSVPEGTSPAPLVSVLAGTDAGRGMGLDTARIGRVPTDSLRRREPEYGPPVFGREVFRRATSQFQPVTTGPVPPDYRVGPGDQLVVVLTGAVEQAYQLEVSDEGWIVIPEVGQVFVNGRTVEELRDVLFDRLAQSYQSLTGEDPATHFDLSVGRLRTNQVYVIGAVEEPSAYVVSSLATAMTALYRAGGPTRNGSFRRIRVNRGGETVATVDLYDYLVQGDASQDVRLQQGDIVHVPPAETQVRLQGPVTRPAIYELAGDEGLRDLLRFAGGVEPNADLRRVQIRRVLPPEERAPGRDRAILDVPVGGLEPPADGGRRIDLRDGDEVQVFAVVKDARNRVTVSGAVWRPGTYGAGDGTRLWDVIRAAGGLLPDAVEARAQIQRLEEETSTRRMIQVSLARDSDGEPAENPRIEGMDQVLIYARRNLREDERVTIGGWVRQPGVYPYARGMTAADLILRAGGVRTGVYTARAEVARPVRSQTVSDTLTRRLEVSLDSSYVFEGRRPAPDELGGEAADFELREGDAVYVRRAPGYEEPKRVVVTGEVRFPGPYSIRTRRERLTDLVERAGGLTEEAYVEGLQLWRAEEPAADTLPGADSLARRRQARIDSLRRARELLLPGQRDSAAAGVAGALADTAAAREAERDSLLLRMYRLQQEVEELELERARDLGRVVEDAPLLPVDSAQMVDERTRVGIDFPRTLDDPDSPSNLLLQPGDSIHVPRYTPTVDVRGAVGVESKVLWREGADLGHYISRAGGYLEEADEDRVWIRFANGEVATRGGKFLFFGGGIPDPDPGSTVNVPFEPPREEDGGISTAQFLGILTSVSTALIVAISR